MRLKKKPIVVTAVSIIAVVLLIFGGFAAVRALGKMRLQHKADIPDRPVQYQDKLYTYNENMLTFLVMGIDKGKEIYEPWEAEIKNSENGQADALFLAAFNTEAHTIRIIGINRNTITTIYDYTNPDGFIPTFRAQISLQHACAPDTAAGCEYQQKIVQDLFYGLPIHGYAAVNVAAVPALNDLVGGVEVEVLEDITLHDSSLVAGSRVHLMGESAYWYVKYRDILQFASVDMRTKRQAQYLDGFIAAAEKTARENPLRLLQMYDELKPQMDTDISIPEAVYLASVLPQYHFDENSFYHIPGETVMGEIYEEFYPDEEALLAMILDIFYEEAGDAR